jgi:hypothetical protein
MKCELCREPAYGLVKGIVPICWECDTSHGSFEPQAEVNA